MGVCRYDRTKNNRRPVANSSEGRRAEGMTRGTSSRKRLVQEARPRTRRIIARAIPGRASLNVISARIRDRVEWAEWGSEGDDEVRGQTRRPPSDTHAVFRAPVNVPSSRARVGHTQTESCSGVAKRAAPSCFGPSSSG